MRGGITEYYFYQTLFVRLWPDNDPSALSINPSCTPVKETPLEYNKRTTILKPCFILCPKNLDLE